MFLAKFPYAVRCRKPCERDRETPTRYICTIYLYLVSPVHTNRMRSSSIAVHSRAKPSTHSRSVPVVVRRWSAACRLRRSSKTRPCRLPVSPPPSPHHRDGCRRCAHMECSKRAFPRTANNGWWCVAYSIGTLAREAEQNRMRVSAQPLATKSHVNMCSIRSILCTTYGLNIRLYECVSSQVRTRTRERRGPPSWSSSYAPRINARRFGRYQIFESLERVGHLMVSVRQRGNNAARPPLQQRVQRARAPLFARLPRND